MSGYIAAFEKFAATTELTNVTLEGLKAVFKVLPDSFDAMDIKIMLTDEADCDEILEKYVAINKTEANVLFKTRTELCELVGKFSESEFAQNITEEAVAAPAEAAPAVAVNAHIAAFSTFAFNAKMSHVTLEGLEAVFKVLPESYDAMDLQIMLTDEADCDELLEKYVSINKTPANELFKVRTELCELVGQFAESEELQNVAAAIVAPAEAAPAVEAPAVNAHIAAFSTFAFNAKMSHVTLEGLEATFKILPESYDAIDLKIMLTDEADCDELLEKYTAINKIQPNDMFKVRTELCELVGQFAETEEAQALSAHADPMAM